MGLASGQARLLSITARLTDNEYRSQRLTNARLNLSTLSENARVEYQDALSQNKFIYESFNGSGKMQKTDLTPTVLWQYQPTKNQYALINTAGKVLVSQEDGDNFKQTDNLMQFLDRYGLFDSYNTEYAQYMSDYAKYENDLSDWNVDMAQWEADCAEVHNKYLEDLEAWHAKYDSKPNLYETFKNEVGTYEDICELEANMEIPLDGRYCYFMAIASSQGQTECYLHLLNELLEYDGGDCVEKYFTASCAYNKSFERTDCRFHTNGEEGGMHGQGDTNAVMAEVSAGIDDPEKFCDGDDDFKPAYLNNGVEDEHKYNMLQAAKDAGREPTAFEILASDYVYNPDTHDCSQLKTIKQKAIDLYYIILNVDKFPEADAETRTNMLINFTEGDMRKIAENPPTEPPIPYEAPLKPQPPIKPEIYIEDVEKSQWYTNLWYRMNGEDNPQEIFKISEDIVSADAEETEISRYLLDFENANKNNNSVAYEILPSNLAYSKDWLNNVLSQGIVSMEKVGVTRTSNENELKWSSIIYSNTTDINTEENSEAIAKAELHYTQILSEVESKDKKFQMQLRSLDTEHNALQTEYSSVKSAVDKNISRSFKVFQG